MVPLQSCNLLTCCADHGMEAILNNMVHMYSESDAFMCYIQYVHMHVHV